MNSRINNLIRFYGILENLQERIGSRITLADSVAQMKWSPRGVYFFMENGEHRSDTGNDLRIVRVGTHALTTDAKSTLWGRLSQHKGQIKTGGGNHRGSVFRLLVGEAIIHKTGRVFPTWSDKKNTVKGDIRKNEEAMEQEVSKIIRAMPFLCLPINDEPNPQSLRGYIERNSIALLSNFGKDAIDKPSNNWLGYHCNRELVKSSGLWNQNHVAEKYDAGFLDIMQKLANEVRA